MKTGVHKYKVYLKKYTKYLNGRREKTQSFMKNYYILDSIFRKMTVWYLSLGPYSSFMRQISFVYKEF